MPSIVVVGDLLIDRYLYCTPKGLSPEAPIISMDVDEIVSKPGGAANVMMNLLALSRLHTERGEKNEVEIKYVGPVPEMLWTILRQIKVEEHFNYYAGRAYQATVKSRIIFREPYQQIIRFDEDRKTPVSKIDEDTIVAMLKDKSYDIGLVSDYNHGSISQEVYDAVRRSCTRVLVDPKGGNPRKYQDATLITPNTEELGTLTGHRPWSPGKDEARKLQAWCGGADVIHKVGEHGCIHYTEKSDPVVYLAYRNGHAVIDPTGAGDTFIAMLAWCFSLDIPTDKAIKAATRLAGISVTQPGCFVPEDKDYTDALYP